VAIVGDAAMESEGKPPISITLKLDEREYMILTAALQLVLRHPAYLKLPSSQIAKEIKNRLINLCPEDRPMMKTLLQLGDNPKFDTKP